MNVRDANRLLTACGVADPRIRADDADVAFWAEVLGDIDLHVALEALKAHYRESADRIMPAHVIAYARRTKRKPNAGHVGALTGPPSWARPDEMQAIVSQHASRCRQAIRASQSTPLANERTYADERQPGTAPAAGTPRD